MLGGFMFFSVDSALSSASQHAFYLALMEAAYNIFGEAGEFAILIRDKRGRKPKRLNHGNTENHVYAAEVCKP